MGNNRLNWPVLAVAALPLLVSRTAAWADFLAAWSLKRRCVIRQLMIRVAALAIVVVSAIQQADAGVTVRNLYVSIDAPNYGNSRIGKLDSQGSLTTFASGLNYPAGLAFDSSRNLYFADYANAAIRRVSPNGVITTFASLTIPYGLAFDTAGNLYASHLGGLPNPNYDTVSKITPDGTVSTFATGLKSPSGLAFDTAGNLYVANRDRGTISKVTPSGSVGTFATGVSAPNGLAFNGNGDLFVSNWGGTITRITPGGSQSTFASSGLTSPLGIAFGDDGNLYVANYDGYTISRISPTGTVGTFASGLGPSPAFLAFEPVPEPSTLALLGVGGISLAAYAWRRRKRTTA